MTRDRLHDLQRRAAADANTNNHRRDSEGGGRETTTEGAEELANLQHVLLETERLHGYVDELLASTLQARVARADPAYSGSPELQQRVESLLSRAAVTGPALCAALRRLTVHATGTTLHARVARLHAACCRTRVSAALHAHHALLAELRDARRDLLAKQLLLLERPLTDEECERLLDDDRGGEQLFVDNVELESASARLALREAESRRNELLAVENKLKEVRDLFLQVAVLIASQQEQIDTVEHLARVTHQHVGSGRQELLKGRVHRRKARNKKLKLLVCVSVGVLIVIIVLALT